MFQYRPHPPLDDPQQREPSGYCIVCQAELYPGDDEEYCPECKENKEKQEED